VGATRTVTTRRRERKDRKSKRRQALQRFDLSLSRSRSRTQLTNSRSLQDKAGVKTKYDRMFNRKSQTILSEHYTKLVDHSDDEDDSLIAATTPSGADDDFITLKRRDHQLEEDLMPESHHLSKRKLKMGQSKKAMLAAHGNPTKLVFDDAGESHQIYELIGEEEFRKDGDAKEQQMAFVEAEREALKVADVKDKERAKEKRREKKRKRKDMDDDVSFRFSCFFDERKLTGSYAHAGTGQRRRT
jgi:ATP-dependent RNA helicase DDX10/DBP4